MQNFFEGLLQGLNPNGVPMNMGVGALTPFNEQYKVFPVAAAGKPHLEQGDKILLPSSALDKLARLKVVYPMMFELNNTATGRSTHCGVLEFSAEEGIAYIPYWMMQNLLVEEGSLIRIRNVKLPLGTFVKLQPHSVRFTELPNPRVILERSMRHFSCLTMGDTIRIPFGDKNYYLDVVEVQPGNAVSVIETDVNLEFAPPKDLKEEEELKKAAPLAAEAAPEASFKFDDDVPDEIATAVVDDTRQRRSSSSYFANLGAGHRLKEKKKKKRKSKAGGTPSASPAAKPAVPAPSAQAPTLNPDPSKPGAVSRPKRVVKDEGKFRYIYEEDPKTGALRLIRRVKAPSASSTTTTRKTSESSSSGFRPFSGKGHSLV